MENNFDDFSPDELDCLLSGRKLEKDNTVMWLTKAGQLLAERNLWRSIVSRNQNICHGIECFIGTRIIVSVVLDLVRCGLTDERVLHELPTLNPYHLKLARKAVELFGG